jgi:hypothetical protein
MHEIKAGDRIVFERGAYQHWGSRLLIVASIQPCSYFIVAAGLSRNS